MRPVLVNHNAVFVHIVIHVARNMIALLDQQYFLAVFEARRSANMEPAKPAPTIIKSYAAIIYSFTTDLIAFSICGAIVLIE